MFVALLASLIPASAAIPQEQPSEPARLDRRANEFTRSSQDSVVLDGDAEGRLVLAWQSRRQQSGTYGIYARAYGPQGQVQSGEVQINANTEGMQMQPSAAYDGEGGLWFAWRSFGADGDQGSIVARRFTGDLTSATSEVLVNDAPEGHQTDPLIAALPDGGALVVWLSPVEGGSSDGVFARRLDASGEPLGKSQRVDSGEGCRHRSPTLATDGQGRALVAYARVDAERRPAGVFVQRIDAGGVLQGEELRVDDSAGIALEPVIDLVDSGQAVVAWLEAQGESYELRTRGLDWQGGELASSSVNAVDVSGEGYTSGIAVSLDGAGAGALSWTRHVRDAAESSLLMTRPIDTQGKPCGDAQVATAARAGAQRLDAARGTRRSLLSPDGRIALAWTGDGQLGDGSGAHLTLVGVAASEETLAQVAAPSEHALEALAQGARPHDPPTYDPRQVQVQGGDTEFAQGGGSLDFQAFSNTGWTPPDPEMAVGMNHIVAMVNGGIGWWLKDGTSQFFQDINGAGGFWGSEGASTFVFDPEVVWDSHTDRFVAFASDANNGFLLAVSDDGDPNGSWNKYRIDTTPIFGTEFIDSGNLAVDDEVITITGDIFSPSRLVMLFIDKTSAYSGGSLVFDSDVISGRHSMGTATNYDGGVQPQYMIWSQESGTATTVSIYSVEDRLTNPSVLNVDVTVPPYVQPNDPAQQGTSVRPELFESRFWSSVVRDGQLWATHHQGNPRPRVRWYQFDLAGWPNSGSQPTLVQSGEVDFGPGIRTYFGSIWVDGNQNMALTYARSSGQEFISMNMTMRAAGDPLGTTGPEIRIFDSNSPDTSGRWGDYSATNDDPAMPGSFWGIHEYSQNGSWRTRVGRIDPAGCVGSTMNYCGTSPNSAGSGALMASSGSTSIAANDMVLTATGCPSNQFGIFFYGQDQVSVASGDGVRCVGGGLFRLPAVNTGVSGVANFALDQGNLPAGGDILTGSTWNFQFWFRDPPFGGAGFNFSDGLQVTFCD